jgi:uncharacterized repeat protein (TIGR03803 family)
VIYRFTGGSDGANPMAGLVADACGALYGTTEYGGDPNILFGAGTAFKLTRSGSGYTETTLHIFGTNDDNANRPNGLLADGTGTLYGTTSYGGAGNAGIIFKLTPVDARQAGTAVPIHRRCEPKRAYVESTLHAFNGSDGRLPFSTLAMQSGVLYGTTYSGGTGCSSNSGCGVVYSFAPSAALFHVLYRFNGGSVGSSPSGSLLVSGNAFYGTTVFGGSTGNGAAYRLEL